MTHALHRVTAFSFLRDFTLRVEFDDGSSQTIDFTPVLRGKLFGPLRDPAVFSKVALDPIAGTLVWPNGADFDPATLHDWPKLKEDFARSANGWRDAAEGEERC
jgi:hypothetical protein